MAEKRVTKREYFEMIREVVEGNDELVAFVDKEIALLSKKRNGQTKAQKANAELAEKVYEILVEKGVAMTATEVFNAANEAGLEGVTSNQKATALLKILVNAGKVNKVTEGKKSTFVAVND